MARNRTSRIVRRLVAVAAAVFAVLLAVRADSGVRRRVASAPCPGSGCEPARLQRLDSCNDLRSYLVEAMLEELVQARYTWWFRGPAGGTDSGGGSAPTDFTTTNNQEEGVDELDIVKTDGTHLFTTADGRLEVVRSWPASDSALLATVDVPAYPEGLFLRHDLVAVVSSSWGGETFRPRWGSATRFDLIDVANPAAPRALRTIEVEGSLVGARLIDGVMFALVATWVPLPQGAWDLIWNSGIPLPEIPWDASEEQRRAAMDTAKEILRPYVERLVADIDVNSVLPLLSDRDAVSGEAVERPLLSCGDLYRPFAAASYGVLSVIRIDLDEPAAEIEATGALASGWTVYASSRNLYVAETRGWWWFSRNSTTTIHKFQLGGEGGLRYTASGEVPGFLLDQFAMGEHEGTLRVASTEVQWWQPAGTGPRSGSFVTVLADSGRGTLATVGQLRGIAPGERIFASRFLGTRGFLITYEQIDPLFTLDLSDPTRPRIVGELEMPGVSTYLHPVGEDYLLAVGLAPGPDGRVSEIAINMFDVHDLAHPTLAQQHVVARGSGQWQWSEALWDHHAFTFHRDVLSIPLWWWDGQTSFSGIGAFSVDAARGITELGRVDHAEMAGPDSWVWMRRSVYVEDYLYSISNAGIKVSRLLRPRETVAVVQFPPTAPGGRGYLAPTPEVARPRAPQPGRPPVGMSR